MTEIQPCYEGRPKESRDEHEQVEREESKNEAVIVNQNYFELLNLSSSEFDTYIKILKEIADFTPDELRRITSMRRRILNRESAHRSRARRKQEFDDLRASNQSLTLENERLRQKIKTLKNKKILNNK